MPVFVPFKPAQHLAWTGAGRHRIGFDKTEPDRFLLPRQIEDVLMEGMIPPSEGRFDLPQMIAKSVGDVGVRRGDIARDDEKFAEWLERL